MENVLRHPVFLAGAATTGFIETYSKELFKFEGHSNVRAGKLLVYLADMVSAAASLLSAHLVQHTQMPRLHAAPYGSFARTAGPAS